MFIKLAITIKNDTINTVTMNYYSIVIYGYILLAGYLIFIIARDIKITGIFFNRHKLLSYIAVIIMTTGILAAFNAHLIEPWTIKTTTTKITSSKLSQSIKIAFISDIQVGNHKKSAWVEKIVERINQERPDLILLGGDQIDNEGNPEDESVYLEPLQALAEKYPIYAVLGNHEYGIGNQVKDDPRYWLGDRSRELIERFQKISIPLLRNEIVCPKIKQQIICIYGADDPWGATVEYTNLNKWDQISPIILLTHNPDAIISWPTNTKQPDLVLAGHTHGGQVYLPIVGPLGEAGINLPDQFYRGLNHYNNTPIYTTVGLGESGGAVRFWTLPEIVMVNLKPQE